MKRVPCECRQGAAREKSCGSAEEIERILNTKQVPSDPEPPLPPQDFKIESTMVLLFVSFIMGRL